LQEWTEDTHEGLLSAQPVSLSGFEERFSEALPHQKTCLVTSQNVFVMSAEADAYIFVTVASSDTGILESRFFQSSFLEFLATPFSARLTNAITAH